MEYLLFALWIALMAIMLGKTIVAHRSLKKMLDRK